MKEKELLKKFNVHNILKNIVLTIFLLGILMNGKAIMNNNCKMPVLFNDKGYILEEDSSHFHIKDDSNISNKWLIDRYSIKLKKKVFVFSIGDFMLYFGFILIILIYINEVYLDYKYYRLKKNENKNND